MVCSNSTFYRYRCGTFTSRDPSLVVRLLDGIAQIWDYEIKDLFEVFSQATIWCLLLKRSGLYITLLNMYSRLQNEPHIIEQIYTRSLWYNRITKWLKHVPSYKTFTPFPRASPRVFKHSHSEPPSASASRIS